MIFININNYSTVYAHFWFEILYAGSAASTQKKKDSESQRARPVRGVSVNPHPRMLPGSAGQGRWASETRRTLRAVNCVRLQRSSLS